MQRIGRMQEQRQLQRRLHLGSAASNLSRRTFKKPSARVRWILDRIDIGCCGWLLPLPSHPLHPLHPLKSLRF
jgi:hypothetical protein